MASLEEKFGASYSSKPIWLDVLVEEQDKPETEQWDFEKSIVQDQWIASETAVIFDNFGADTVAYCSPNAEKDAFDVDDISEEVAAQVPESDDCWMHFSAPEAPEFESDDWDTSSRNIEDRRLMDEGDCSDDQSCELAPIDLTFLGNRFREWHYFYNFVRMTLEDSCRGAVVQAWGERPEDLPWLRYKLCDPDVPMCRVREDMHAMADKEWSQQGQIELDGWAYFFDRVGVQNIEFKDKTLVFGCANNLRQAAIHRNHSRLSKADLEVALQLPAILLDEQRSSEVQKAYQIVLQDPSERSSEDQDHFSRLVYAQEDAPIQLTQLLDQLQHLCERSAFAYAQEKNPQFLECRSATDCERIELQEYLYRWENRPELQHPSSSARYPDPDGNGWQWRQTLYDAKKLRNEATHRTVRVTSLNTTRNFIDRRVTWAKTFALMVGDSAQVKKIEEIAKEWLTHYGPPEESEEDENSNTEEQERRAAETAAFDAEWEAAISR